MEYFAAHLSHNGKVVVVGIEIGVVIVVVILLVKVIVLIALIVRVDIVLVELWHIVCYIKWFVPF